MATKAICKVDSFTIDEGRIRTQYTVVVHDDQTVPNGEENGVFVYFPFTASPTQMEDALETAVIDMVFANYAKTITRANIIYFDIIRGS